MHDIALIYATAGYAWSYDQFLRLQLVGTPLGGIVAPGDGHGERLADRQLSRATLNAGGHRH